jgi:MOSC domain-containing protein YiiM
MPPIVVAIQLCRAHAEPLVPVSSVNAVEGAGLEGDLHQRPGSRRQVLFVDQEILDELGLAPGVIREQVTVRGLDVQHLEPGATVRIGGARFVVAKPCDPCELMDEIRPGLRTLLEDRRGRFLSVVGSGTFATGDEIVVG